MELRLHRHDVRQKSDILKELDLRTKIGTVDNTEVLEQIAV